MAAQTTKQRNVRYTRQTELSRSRRTYGTERSTSGYSRGSASSERVSGNIGYSSTNYRNISYGGAVYGRQRTTATDELTKMRRSAVEPRASVTAPRKAAESDGRLTRTAGTVAAPPRRANVSGFETDRGAAVRTAQRRIFYCLGFAVIFLMCVIILYRQTAIFSMNREIDKLNTNYNDILVTNEEIQTNINKSIELGNLESVAKNELGMISPDSSQVFYIDMGNRDSVVKSGKSGD